MKKPLQLNSKDCLAPRTHPFKILCYSPYTYFTMHGMREMTILQAMKLRGAEVRYVFCNGLFSDCDIFLTCTKDINTPLKCQKCQAQAATLAYELGMEFEWLGQQIEKEKYIIARKWVDKLECKDLFRAQFGAWKLGEWVESSVHTDLRISDLDFTNPIVEKKYRSLLYSGLISAFGVTQLLNEYQPDIVFLFNGRMTSLRVTLELAKEKGVRVITHEIGLMVDTMRLYENADCLSLDQIKKTWKNWGNVPLNKAQIEEINDFYVQKQQGKRVELKFSPPLQTNDFVLKELNLNISNPIWVLFTSSDDELIAAPELHGPLSQKEWIEQTVKFVSEHPEVQLVIRVHPNTAGSRASRGSNLQQLHEMEELRDLLPANVIMVMPEDLISSYTLMDICTAGLVYCSITGLELACKGKMVLAAAGGYVSESHFQ